MGHIVTAEVAKLLSGDADGDLLIVVTDKKVVDLFRRYLNTELVSGLKPAKTKAKVALTADYMIDTALERVGNAWMVGSLTIAAWKLIQAKMFEMASEMLDLANIEPMTYKHSISFDGVPFAEVVREKYNSVKTTVKEINLQWRDKAIEALAWNSVRQMADARIETPASHIDACWNAGVDAAKTWRDNHPLEPLSIAAVARLAFGKSGEMIPGWAWREAREVIAMVGRVLGWRVFDAGGNAVHGDHRGIYQDVCKWGRNASREAIAAVLLWRPKDAERNGFGLKWHSCFASGRAHEAIGFSADVKAEIEALQNKAADKQSFDALAERLANAFVDINGYTH